MEHTKKVPILLVHGTWGNAWTWDFPGRSVMDYLAIRGYDVYALDLRGMGESQRPDDYATIDLLDRVHDLVAVAGHIVETTGRRPVVTGWSQGALLTALMAAQTPELVAGVGLFGMPGNGYYIPPEFLPLIDEVIRSGVDRYVTSAEVTFAMVFAVDPVTGKPTINEEAFQTYMEFCEPDSVNVTLQELSTVYFQAVIAPVLPSIRVPALVADGALAIGTGEERARALFDALGSERKQLFIFPRNSHGWFLEDNSQATLRAFDRFLAEFK